MTATNRAAAKIYFFLRLTKTISSYLYLSSDSDQKKPLETMICPVVDDLTSSQRLMPVKHFDWLRISFHRPVIDCCLCHNSNGVNINPFPKQDVISHCMSLHLGLHFDVKDLKSSHGSQGNDLGSGIHDGIVCRDRSSNWGLRVCHVNDDHLGCISYFFSHTDKFVWLHCKGIEADVSRLDANSSELHIQDK